MISKELLSEVLCVKINVVMNPEKTPNHLQIANELTYFDENNFVNQINIYELMYLCKEWAKNQGYIIGVDLDNVNVWSIKERRVVNHFEIYWENYLEFEFKACEWILNDKD